MSTKATIAHGPNFHLYHDLLDEDNVYLELEGTQFEAGYNRVMVPIPVHVWEVIRQYPGIDLEYVDKTDAELSQLVEHQVDDRIKKYEEADERRKAWSRYSARSPLARQTNLGSNKSPQDWIIFPRFAGTNCKSNRPLRNWKQQTRELRAR